MSPRRDIILAKVQSYGLNGLEAYPVTIEVDVAGGLPSTTIVGLPDNAVRESKERMRSAIKNCGFDFPSSRITINLSPADVKKEGPSFDLAMSLGYLAATGQIDATRLSEYVFLGELSLDGSVRPVQGSLSVALAMKDKRKKGLIVPLANAAEAAIAGTAAVHPVKNLHEVVHFLSYEEPIVPFKIDVEKIFKDANLYPFDFSEVKGQAHAKRGLEIAAAGGHNCLLIGPPGSGKSMLAKRFMTILPDIELEEALEVTQIYSATGLLRPGESVIKARPFRCPHHTTSDVAIVGGGSNPRPGEVTLSHNGVLFLDELPEFHRNVLEALRQPLEDHCVTIARAIKSLRFPSRFILIAAMNPCPCGWYTDPKKECHCSSFQVQRYLSKISGPLLDRIDIHLDVPNIPSTELLKPVQAESSAAIKERTVKARAIQKLRFKDTSILANAQMNHKQIKEFCGLDDEGKKLFRQAIDELGFSGRAYDKILRVARTIADLAGEENISVEHLAEAIQYRSLDRSWWG